MAYLEVNVEDIQLTELAPILTPLVTVVVGFFTLLGVLATAIFGYRKVFVEKETKALETEAAKETEGKKVAASQQEAFADDVIGRISGLEAENKTLREELAAMNLKFGEVLADLAEIKGQLTTEKGTTAHLRELLDQAREQHDRDREQWQRQLDEERQRRRFAESTADMLSDEIEVIEHIDNAGERSRYVSKLFKDRLRRLPMKTPARSLTESLEEKSERREDEGGEV